MRGYQYLARYMPFMEGVVQSLVAMTWQLGIILPEEARRLFDEIREEYHNTR
jgi:hypothetical protein